MITYKAARPGRGRNTDAILAATEAEQKYCKQRTCIHQITVTPTESKYTKQILCIHKNTDNKYCKQLTSQTYIDTTKSSGQLRK